MEGSSTRLPPLGCEVSVSDTGCAESGCGRRTGWVNREPRSGTELMEVERLTSLRWCSVGVVRCRDGDRGNAPVLLQLQVIMVTVL